MHYAYRFRLKPTPDQRELLEYHRDTCRQLYNHALKEFNEILNLSAFLREKLDDKIEQRSD